MDLRSPMAPPPVRTCVGCRERAAKHELLRVVADDLGEGLERALGRARAREHGRLRVARHGGRRARDRLLAPLALGLVADDGVEVRGAGEPRGVAVGAVALLDGALLLVRRGRGPAAGEWSVPGGRVEPGETVHIAERWF